MESVKDVMKAFTEVTFTDAFVEASVKAYVKNYKT